MTLKTTLHYSPNFSFKKRTFQQVKFIIFHYTGMKKESAAIKRLTNLQSEVSSHYLIKKNGEIVNLVPDLYVAWHAGVSSWKNYKSLNKNSIGIEISNSGHEHNYKKFSVKQISSLLKLSKFLIKEYKINLKNILGHSDIAPHRKKDPGEKFPWKYLAKNKICIWHKLSPRLLKKNRMLNIDNLSKEYFYNNLFQVGYSKKPPKNTNNDKYLNSVVRAFQRRFRPELINGKIDKECLLIANDLLNKFN